MDKKWVVKIPNIIWQVPRGIIAKRPGVEYLCEASGPLLDASKKPKNMNEASLRKWSAESNGLRHLRVV